MTREKNEVLVEISRINQLLNQKNLNEQVVGGVLPFNPMHTYKNIKKIGDWVGTWDKKDWLTFVELTSGVLGAIPSPASPILLGISMGAGIANAKIYYDEGDVYGAGLYLTFTLLGAGALIKILRNSKTFMSLGQKRSLELIQKVNSGAATEAEKKTMKSLIEEIGPSTKELAKETSKEIVKRILTELPKKGLMYVLKLCIAMSKLGVFGIKEGIVISGTFLAYDKIYKALNYKNEKNLSVREKNELVQLYRFIVSNKEEITDLMVNEIEKVEPAMMENAKTLMSIDTTYQLKF